MEANDFLRFDIPTSTKSIIKVIGVGGGGSNAVNYMYQQGILGVDFMICNTDHQALSKSPVPIKLQLGATITEGLGAGSKPEIGKQAAIESREDIMNVLGKGTKMVFITAGMGGGTGTGAAPEIAKVAQELNILTVGIVTLPFKYEGKLRINQAHEGLKELENHVDALLIINNNLLKDIYPDISVNSAFNKADDVLTTAARGIAEIITRPALVNTDFADVNTVMRKSGVALMGSAKAGGPTRAIDAIEAALECPLLNNNDIRGARNVLVHISYGTKEVSMIEHEEIMDLISERVGSSVEQVIAGLGHDDTLGDDIQVTVVATGFSHAQLNQMGGAPARNVQTPQQPQNFHPQGNFPPQQTGFGQPNYQQYPNQGYQNMPPQGNDPYNQNYPPANGGNNGYGNNQNPSNYMPPMNSVDKQRFEELYGVSAPAQSPGAQQRAMGAINNRPRTSQFNADDDEFMRKVKDIPAFNMINGNANPVSDNGYGRTGMGNGQIVKDIPFLHDNKD